MNLSSESEPCSYQEATSQQCWQNSMNAKIEALILNKTWDIVNTAQNVKTMGCK